MANYDVAYNQLKEDEGGFSLRSTDPGGYTYMGITKKNFPNFPGWDRVAYWVSRYGGPAKAQEKIFPDPELNAQAKNFIYNNFWLKYKCDQIEDQHLAAHVYDFCFNSGQGARIINQALGTGNENRITDTTVAKLNSGFPFVINNMIYRARYQYITSLKMPYKGRVIKVISVNPGLLTRIENYKNYKAYDIRPSRKTFDIFKTFWGN